MLLAASVEERDEWVQALLRARLWKNDFRRRYKEEREQKLADRRRAGPAAADRHHRHCAVTALAAAGRPSATANPVFGAGANPPFGGPPFGGPPFGGPPFGGGGDFRVGGGGGLTRPGSSSSSRRRMSLPGDACIPSAPRRRRSPAELLAAVDAGGAETAGPGASPGAGAVVSRRDERRLSVVGGSRCSISGVRASLSVVADQPLDQLTAGSPFQLPKESRNGRIGRYCVAAKAGAACRSGPELSSSLLFKFSEGQLLSVWQKAVNEDGQLRLRVTKRAQASGGGGGEVWRGWVSLYNKNGAKLLRLVAAP